MVRRRQEAVRHVLRPPPRPPGRLLVRLRAGRAGRPRGLRPRAVLRSALRGPPGMAGGLARRAGGLGGTRRDRDRGLPAGRPPPPAGIRRLGFLVALRYRFGTPQQRKGFWACPVTVSVVRSAEKAAPASARSRPRPPGASGSPHPRIRWSR